MKPKRSQAKTLHARKKISFPGDYLIHFNVGRIRKRMRKTIILEDTSGKAVF